MGDCTGQGSYGWISSLPLLSEQIEDVDAIVEYPQKAISFLNKPIHELNMLLRHASFMNQIHFHVSHATVSPDEDEK